MKNSIFFKHGGLCVFVSIIVQLDRVTILNHCTFSVSYTFTFTFRAFGRCFYPKRLTISTFVERH